MLGTPDPIVRLETAGSPAARARSVRPRLAVPKPSVPYRHLLLLRFVLLNLVAASLVAAAYLKGWVEPVFRSDPTHLTLVIVVVFLAGLGLCGYRIVQTSRELDRARSFDPASPEPSRAAAHLSAVRGRSAGSRAILVAGQRMKFASRIAAIRHVASSLVFLGLIGTVVGFIIALSGVSPEAVSDVSAVAPMVSSLIRGMSVALYTTLIGTVLNLWLMTNYRMLASAKIDLLNSIVASGEDHARA